MKIDGVYNSISTILFVTLPPPKTHLTFSLNKNIAVLWINFKIQTSLHFSPGTLYIYSFYLRHFIRGTVQEVTGQLMSLAWQNELSPSEQGG